ncbi:MAG: hypothetical protein ACI9EF_003183 [Pseudohongiellaceae bacterium]|jgi:hypothetical protein
MDKDVRRLGVTVLALLVFLFVGRAVVGSVFDDEGERRAALSARNSLSGAGAGRPRREAAVQVQELRGDLHDQLSELLPQLAYQRPEDFDVPPGRSADLFFLDALRREQETLVQAGRFLGKAVPFDLGMPVPNPTGTEDVLVALRALHVVRLVVTAALEADCAGIDKIKMVSEGRSASRAALVRTHGVHFDLRGRPGALAAMLSRLVRGRPYLALADVNMEALDEDGELLRCRMEVGALSFDRESVEDLELLP